MSDSEKALPVKVFMASHPWQLILKLDAPHPRRIELRLDMPTTPDEIKAFCRAGIQFAGLLGDERNAFRAFADRYGGAGLILNGDDTEASQIDESSSEAAMTA